MKDIKKSQQVQNKREKEKQIVDLMIHLYCVTVKINPLLCRGRTDL